MRGALIVGLILLSIVSLGLKFMIERPLNYDDLETTILGTASKKLRQNGFVEVGSTNPSVMGAVHGDCYLWMTAVRPQGGQDDLFEYQFGSGLKVVYIFDHMLFLERPTLLPIAKRMMEKLRQLAGRHPRPQPVFQLAHSVGCDERALADIIDAEN